MVDKVFLTENRRDVLEGESTIQEDSLAVAKSRIRTRTRMALRELIEVAESGEIDNEDVFDVEAVRNLVFAILGPPENIEPRYEARERDELSQHREQYQYEEDVYRSLNALLNSYEHCFALFEPSTNPPHEIEGGLRDG